MAYINILELLYPVGSLYFSIENISPSEIIGGIWIKINDNAMLGVGNGYAGNQTITVEQMPQHTHNFKIGPGTNSGFGMAYVGDTNTNYYYNNLIVPNGGGQPYIPYYYGVNIWVRTS